MTSKDLDKAIELKRKITHYNEILSFAKNNASTTLISILNRNYKLEDELSIGLKDEIIIFYTNQIAVLEEEFSRL